MFNDITLGPVTLHMYGLMIGLGFASALIMCSYRGKKQQLNDDIITGIFMCALIGGLAGTRLLYYIVELPQIIKEPSLLWNFKNGYVVYGGIIGGILTSYLYCKHKKVQFLPYFDLVMPAVAFAQGCGRIGCFFAGCCYGRQTDSWLGIIFHNSRFAPNEVKLLPTQLLSSAGDFLICGLLLFYASKKPIQGRVAAGYMILYGLGRFGIEFLRNDHRGSIGFLSTSQIISIGIVAIGAAFYGWLPKLAKADTDKEF